MITSIGACPTCGKGGRLATTHSWTQEIRGQQYSVTLNLMKKSSWETSTLVAWLNDQPLGWREARKLLNPLEERFWEIGEFSTYGMRWNGDHFHLGKMDAQIHDGLALAIFTRFDAVVKFHAIA